MSSNPSIYNTNKYECREITPELLDDFSAKSPLGNFQQTSAMGRVRIKNNTEVSYLGFFENDKLVGACILEIHGQGIGRFAEVHDGPMCDFHNVELLEFVVSELRKHAKEAGAVQLVITPEVLYRIHDMHGCSAGDEGVDLKYVPKGAEFVTDNALLMNLEDCGFAHEGFSLGYSAVPRWRFLKDLTGIKNEQELLNSYPSSTKRNNVRLAIEGGVIVKVAGREDLQVFNALCEKSCDKHGFQNRSIKFYEDILDEFGKSVELDIAYIDTKKQVELWESKVAKFKADITKLEDSLENTNNKKRVNGRITDLKDKLAGAERRLAKAREYAEMGDMIPIACAMFIWHERECIYLYSGSDPKYNNLYGSNAIQHELMKKCIERGCSRYNFYGINGIFDDPKDEGRGVLEFKQGFGGYVEELLGVFEMPVQPAKYKLKKLAHRVLGR